MSTPMLGWQGRCGEHTYNPSNGEEEAGGRVQGYHSLLYSEFKASLSYLRPLPETTTTNKIAGLHQYPATRNKNSSQCYHLAPSSVLVTCLWITNCLQHEQGRSHYTSQHL